MGGGNRNGANGKRFGVFRVASISLLLLIQIAAIIVVSTRLREVSAAVFTVFEGVALIAVIHMLVSTDSPSYKITWTLLMLLAPFVGLTLYAVHKLVTRTKHGHAAIASAFIQGFSETPQDPAVRDALGKAHPDLAHISQYLSGCGFPAYRNTEATYYPLGDLWWIDLIQDVQNAQRFVFIATFIIEGGAFWEQLMCALRQKAAEGLDVRLMYDDIGSIVTIPRGDIEQLRAEGIQIQAFNDTTRYTQAFYLNYRNHQKIAIIDGDIAHTGGANIADEYINRIEKHGHWKDTCVRLRGDATWGLTVTFLQMWDLNRNDVTDDYTPFRPQYSAVDASGFFQPMADGPANNPKNPALDLFKLMISGARSHCYITTPYLVVDYDLMSQLCLAGRSGVDVRIVVPHIPDHWYVHMVTRSFYGELLSAGVRVFEYTPGYIHAKMVAVDGKSALIGTINVDFRSFYLHYENAVWTCGSPTVSQIEADICQTLESCTEIRLEEWVKRPWYVKWLQSVLRIFAPMM